MEGSSCKGCTHFAGNRFTVFYRTRNFVALLQRIRYGSKTSKAHARGSTEHTHTADILRTAGKVQYVNTLETHRLRTKTDTQ